MPVYPTSGAVSLVQDDRTQPNARGRLNSTSSLASMASVDGRQFVARSAKRRPGNDRRVGHAGTQAVSSCVVAVKTAESRLQRHIGKAVSKVEHACIHAGMRVLKKLAPGGSGVMRRAAIMAAMDPAQEQARRQLDGDIASLRTHKKAFKKARPALKATLKKLGRIEAAVIKCRKDVRRQLEKDSTHLCGGLPTLSVAQARVDSGHGPGLLESLLQKGREVTGMSSRPTLEEAAQLIDRLWTHGQEEANADRIAHELAKLRGKVPSSVALESAIGQCRDLIESGVSLRRQRPSELGQWDQALADFQNEKAQPCAGMLGQIDGVKRLPNPGRDDWTAQLARDLDLLPPTTAETQHFIKRHVGRAMRGLSDNAFDEVCRAASPGGYMGAILIQADRVKSAGVLEAWREAVNDERMRRYETEPLSELAALTRRIEANAIQGMSDRGCADDEVPLPDQLDLYLQGRNAVHALLRGMCLSMRGDDQRSAYLSRLIMERAPADVRATLLETTTWRKDAVLDALMAGISRITANGDLMVPQYRRLLQEMHVILKGDALPASTGHRTRWRDLTDFDTVEGALLVKKRGPLRKVWDKVSFWAGYLVIGSSARMEHARFSYHTGHLYQRIQAAFKPLERHPADAQEVRRAFRNMLIAADDVRAHFAASQFPAKACDRYLRMEFSRAVATLGPDALKNLYRNLQQPCQDMRINAPRFAWVTTVQEWWRNKFLDTGRLMPRDSLEWQQTANRCWAALREAVEQEPEARSHAYLLVRLSDKFDRDSKKDYEGIKQSLDSLIKRDGGTWSGPDTGNFTTYDAAWARLNQTHMHKMLARLGRYEGHMDDFLKTEAVTSTIGEENRFIYRYYQQALLNSGRSFEANNPMNRYAERSTPLEGVPDTRADLASLPSPAALAVPPTPAAA
ncbi:hypothetical protein CAL12_26220 [Bordetella genomosp. 8]|uniref:Uncharacterized protein n=1 Tax=Bordetella genomosp. 8 TaxID=1416806 RepID=A0A1W6YSK0_9BORD|nr:hypothetical protein [Bordetella genomosp. 8]ARP83964.1 hypothetical protein CAL12_26220 [Bordetella genomosp. 8]